MNDDVNGNTHDVELRGGASGLDNAGARDVGYTEMAARGFVLGVFPSPPQPTWSLALFAGEVERRASLRSPPRGRRSHHPAEGEVPHHALRPLPDAPLTLSGALTTVIVARVPPLWHRIMTLKGGRRSLVEAAQRAAP